jgi:hypothetical protein
MEDATKEPSIYMRFHVTLERAMNLITATYQDRTIPRTEVSLLDHAVQIAGLTEEIESQDYLDYHLTWLTGALKDLPTLFPDDYRKNIEDVLVELRGEEAARVRRYVEQLSGDLRVAEGERCRRMAERVGEMDAIPCYIQIFELYSYCSLWKRLKWERPAVEYEGYMAYAYMFFYKAISRHIAIGRNLKQDIKLFFRTLCDELGGMGSIRTKAELFYKLE